MNKSTQVCHFAHIKYRAIYKEKYINYLKIYIDTVFVLRQSKNEVAKYPMKKEGRVPTVYTAKTVIWRET